MAVRLAPVPAAALLAAAPSRDARLQAARRLDWRFLLPEPSLGRVAYLGPGADGLLVALRASADVVTVVRGDPEPPRAALHRGTHDVAVLQAPRPADIACAAALLRPGGWVYCELARPAERGAPGLRRARALLAASGFRDATVHWHHPDFERCRRMVPLLGPSVSAYLFARGGGPLLAPLVSRAAIARLASALDAWALRTAGVAGLLPCTSIVARREGAP